MKTIFFSLFIILLFFACDLVENDPPKGACTYGPPEINFSACVVTTESDCIDNFNGVWFEGQECP